MKSKGNEKTRRKTQKRRKRTTRSLAQAPSQEKILRQRYQGKKTQKLHPAQKDAQKAEVNATYYPFIKYEDIGDVPYGGRQVAYWRQQAIIPMFPKFRKGTGVRPLPKSFHFWDHAFLMKYFGLRSWEFGNWVTTEDRLNYVCAVGIALYDLRTVLGFKATQIGLERMISMAIGARGQGARGQVVAVAHFEPGTFAINLTRYATPSSARRKYIVSDAKLRRFLTQGGVGALAHEYGHALDYFFGGYVDQANSHFALSEGNSIRTRPKGALMKEPSLRGLMERLLAQIIWEKPGTYSAYYLRIQEYRKRNRIKSVYYIQRNELFARFFEQYVGYKLQQKGIQNELLHHAKYQGVPYLPEAHLKKLVPTMDKLAAKMRAYLKTKT